MATDHLEAPCPSWLEDEAFLIETSGEMPEVALQESLLHTGPLEEQDLDCLRAAAARCYLRLLARDLDPGLVGQPQFRGLERAAENLGRLRRYLGKLGWPLPARTLHGLTQALACYLGAEAQALEEGRGYASATAGQVKALAAELGLDLAPFTALLARLAGLPVPDFRGLTALKRLGVPGACYKRRSERGGGAVVEALAEDACRSLARVALPLLGPSGQEDPQARARAELVWGLLALPEVPA